jgi:very-short-patch-repair endonuclease
MKAHNISKFKDRRRELRIKATLAEEILWRELRNNKLGVRFRRQHSFKGYIFDFYCPKKRLIVEVDGHYHQSIDQKEYDKERDSLSIEYDFKVLRVTNKEVDTNLSSVIKKIKRLL